MKIGCKPVSMVTHTRLESQQWMPFDYGIPRLADK